MSAAHSVTQRAFPGTGPAGPADQPSAPTEALVVLAGDLHYRLPVATLRRAVRDTAATPTVLADLRPPRWWQRAIAAAAQAHTVPPGGWVSDDVERDVRAAIATCAELDGATIHVTRSRLSREVARRLQDGGFHHVALLARPRDRRVVREVLRGSAGCVPVKLYWVENR